MCRAVIVLLALQFAIAQAQVTVSPGSRVRVMKIPDRLEPRVTGTVVSLNGDSAVVDLRAPGTHAYSPPNRTSLPLARLEVFAGERKRTTEGAIRGVLIGGAIGWGFATRISGVNCDYCLERNGTLRAVVPVTASVGFLFGHLWGYNRKRERWIPVGSVRRQ